MIENHRDKRPDHNKYLFLHVQDHILTHILRFLGYWEIFGYEKYTRFASSLRFEMIVRVDAELNEKYYVQFIYDDEVIKFPWCDNVGLMCPLETFTNFVIEHIIPDPDYLERFCHGQAGTDYLSMK